MKGFRMPGETVEGKEASAEGGRIRRKVVKAVDGSEEFGWESEDRGGRSSGAETPGSLRPILFGGLAVLMLMVGVVVSIVINQELSGKGRTMEEDVRREALGFPVRKGLVGSALDIQNTDLKAELADVVMIVEKFLGAGTVEEVLAATRQNPGLEQKIRDYYRTRRLTPVVPKAIAPEGRMLKSQGLWAVDVLLPDYSVKPIAAERVNDGYVIDWESWVGYSEVPWEEVGKVRPTKPVLFRVLCAPINYYNFGFTDDRKWRSYRLQSPDRKHTLYGYVKRLSIQESMLTWYDTKPGQSRAYILRIRFTDESGPDQVIIEEVVESGWVRAGFSEPARVPVEQ